VGVSAKVGVGKTVVGVRVDVGITIRWVRISGRFRKTTSVMPSIDRTTQVKIRQRLSHVRNKRDMILLSDFAMNY